MGICSEYCLGIGSGDGLGIGLGIFLRNSVGIGSGIGLRNGLQIDLGIVQGLVWQIVQVWEMLYLLCYFKKLTYFTKQNNRCLDLD